MLAGASLKVCCIEMLDSGMMHAAVTLSQRFACWLCSSHTHTQFRWPILNVDLPAFCATGHACQASLCHGRGHAH